ncbi:hypothetical protein WT72_21780 [Burkholderia pseudomultivorans]|nr:hypothetical protein WT72_21780 [Burkholderia pseudomultivorans]
MAIARAWSTSKYSAMVLMRSGAGGASAVEAAARAIERSGVGGVGGPRPSPMAIDRFDRVCRDDETGTRT